MMKIREIASALIAVFVLFVLFTAASEASWDDDDPTNDPNLCHEILARDPDTDCDWHWGWYQQALIDGVLTVGGQVANKTTTVQRSSAAGRVSVSQQEEEEVEELEVVTGAGCIENRFGLPIDNGDNNDGCVVYPPSGPNIIEEEITSG